MKKLSWYKYDVKLILNLANFLKACFNIDGKIEEDSVTFSLKKDYNKKQLIITFAQAKKKKDKK